MSREAWPIEYHRHASVTVDLVTIVLCCFASLYRPDGQKKAYVRLAPDYDALDVANKVGTNESLACWSWHEFISQGIGTSGVPDH